MNTPRPNADPHQPSRSSRTAIGRGAQSNPANRFERLRLVPEESQEFDAASEFADVQEFDQHQGEPAALETDAAGDRTNDATNDARGKEPLRLKAEWIADESKSVVTENSSPDLEFRYSLNPYRGCEHGCSYCYARTYHEYLGYSAGLDFETKIVYKANIANLFRDWLSRPSYVCEYVAISGATDCYQPAEKHFGLTRAVLEVALECRQPMGIVTKNALILRDLDLLSQLAELDLVHVNISLTSLDQGLIKCLEPRTSSPAARLRTLETLADAGVPTRALLSPIVPGLNDSEIPAMLEAVHATGVRSASFSLLRLPGVVEEIFVEWLRTQLPSQADRIESRIRKTRSNELNDHRFGKRLQGEGVIANQIQQTFAVFAKRYGMTRMLRALNTDRFRRPGDRQRRLF